MAAQEQLTQVRCPIGRAVGAANKQRFNRPPAHLDRAGPSAPVELVVGKARREVDDEFLGTRLAAHEWRLDLAEDLPRVLFAHGAAVGEESPEQSVASDLVWNRRDLVNPILHAKAAGDFACWKREQVAGEERREQALGVLRIEVADAEQVVALGRRAEVADKRGIERWRVHVHRHTAWLGIRRDNRIQRIVQRVVAAFTDFLADVVFAGVPIHRIVAKRQVQPVCANADASGGGF